MPFNAVVFDLDGTLLDTLEDLADSMNEALTGLGFAPHPRDAYRHFVGDGIRKLVQRTLPERARSDEMIDRGLEAMRSCYAERWNQKTRLYPGVAEMLDGLCVQKIPLAVFSNKPDPFTRQVVATLLGRWSFQVVRGALPEVPVKPDPAGAFAVAQELGVPPAEVLYVGDTNTDMQTACHAGFYAVGVSWGFRDAEELWATGAKAVIHRPPDLLPLLNQGTN